MRELVGLSWDVAALAMIATFVTLALIVIAQAITIRGLRRQLAEAEEDIEQLEAGRGHDDVRFLEVRRG